MHTQGEMLCEFQQKAERPVLKIFVLFALGTNESVDIRIV